MVVGRRSAIRRSDRDVIPAVPLFDNPPASGRDLSAARHAHLVLDHRYGVISGGAQMLIVLNRTACLFLATQLRKGGGQDEVEKGRPIL